jgi:hypothetical protein
MFPTGYEPPKIDSKYFKPVDGNNLVRILSKPLMGWEDWTEDKKPVRFPYNQKPEHPINPKKPIKHFWAFVVWDYMDNFNKETKKWEGKIKIWEITQMKIQETLYNLDCDIDWGEPTHYDLAIKREGKDLDTKYLIQSKPPKPLSEEIKAAFIESNPDMNELFTNGDPFSKKAEQPVQTENEIIDDFNPNNETQAESIPF